MKLRAINKKDAIYMLEWMHDDSVVHFLSTNFAAKTLEDCESFIENSKENQENLNLAIVDENDQYMGTVSLKHIDPEMAYAEFAITIRKCAMGQGYSTFGMAEILNLGKEKLSLNHIYWCVSTENQRAVRFYDKNHYKRATDVPENILKNYTFEQNKSFIWYVWE